MKVSRREIVLDPFTIEDAVVVDVRFDGHRVWSVRVPWAEDGRIVLRWPGALRARLSGRTTVTITDSASDRVIDRADVRFGVARRRLRIVDGRGRWLAMTKWDRLGPVLEGRDEQVGTDLLRNGQRLVRDLQEDGHDVYIVGGTLLGIVRDGGLMPHDDDVDLAYYSKADNPLDIGLESYRMERALQKRGYTVVRHSLTHLEVEFFNEAGEPDHYVDIFTGFFRDGLYSQPFALRGPEVKPEDLLPTRDRDIRGFTFPEPANPEAWLSYAYGSGWRIPDPTFKFISPKSTTARFETWFGVFNRGRVYWDKHYLGVEQRSGFAPASREIRRFLRDVPPGARVLDLGCGDGRWSRVIADHGYRVTGVDYSHEALRLARGDDAGGGVDFRYLNLNDRAAVLEFGSWVLETGEEWFVFAHHSVQALTKTNRQNVLLLLDMVLRGRGFAHVISDVTLSYGYRRSAPSTWHLPTDWLVRESEGHPLSLVPVGRARRREGMRWRPTETVRVRRLTGRIESADAAYRRIQRESAAQERE